jgi:hypothetical protein
VALLWKLVIKGIIVSFKVIAENGYKTWIFPLADWEWPKVVF